MINASPKPEEIYRAATTKEERKRLRAEVIAAHRPLVERFVRRTVPAAHVEAAEQVGCIGILLALEKYDPASRSEFRFFAFGFVRDEIEKYIDRVEAAAYAARFVADEIELESGRQISVELKTADGAPATRGEFVEALRCAARIVEQPVED